MKNTSQELYDVSDGEVLIQTKDLKHPSCPQTIFMGGTQLRSQAVNLAPVKICLIRAAVAPYYTYPQEGCITGM